MLLGGRPQRRSWEVTTLALKLALVERNVRARVGGMFSHSTVRVSAMPSRRLAAAPGCVRWLTEPLREVTTLAGMDRKTVHWYVQAAQARWA